MMMHGPTNVKLIDTVTFCWLCWSTNLF